MNDTEETKDATLQTKARLVKAMVFPVVIASGGQRIGASAPNNKLKM